MDKSIKIEIPLDHPVPVKDRPHVHFTTKAQAKIDALVFTSAIEVGWHMLITRAGNVYTVHDVIVYPQIATAATVEGDDDHYPLWITELDDLTFEQLKGQGHSHVNMGVRPSSTDTRFYEDLLTVAKDYYLFMIVNKRGEAEFFLYDIVKNKLYFKEDLNVSSDMDIWSEEMLTKYVSKPKGAARHGSQEKLHVLSTGESY